MFRFVKVLVVNEREWQVSNQVMLVALMLPPRYQHPLARTN